MHPRAAKKAEKSRQRAEDHQRRLAEEKAVKDERLAKSRSRRPSPRRESRPEGRHPSPRRHRAGKDRSDRKRRQKSEEKDQLTVEEEETYPCSIGRSPRITCCEGANSSNPSRVLP